MSRRKKKKLLTKSTLFAFGAAAALIASIMFPWGYTQDPSKVTGNVGLVFGARLAAAATGKGVEIDSSLALTALKIPAWSICLLGAVGVLGVVAKRSRIVRVPRLFCLVSTGIALVFAVSLLLFLLNGGIQVGFLLLTIGAGLGLFVSWKHA